ncbi:unnamed protein product, partial [Rotaria socialis]
QGSNNFDDDYQGEYRGDAPFQVPPRENPYPRQGSSEQYESEDSYGRPDYNEREGFSREFINEQPPRYGDRQQQEPINREWNNKDNERQSPRQ